MKQGSLFNPREGRRRRDLAIDRVASTTSAEEWLDQALPVLAGMTRKPIELTTDDIWQALSDAGVERPSEPRAMGALLREAKRSGWLTPTDRYVPSKRPGAHRNPKRVWRAVPC